MTTPAQDLQARFSAIAAAFQEVSAQFAGAAADLAALYSAQTMLDFSSLTNSGLLAAFGG